MQLYWCEKVTIPLFKLLAALAPCAGVEALLNNLDETRKFWKAHAGRRKVI